MCERNFLFSLFEASPPLDHLKIDRAKVLLDLERATLEQIRASSLARDQVDKLTVLCVLLAVKEIGEGIVEGGEDVCETLQIFLLDHGPFVRHLARRKLWRPGVILVHFFKPLTNQIPQRVEIPRVLVEKGQAKHGPGIDFQI